ncbi:PQ-loop domain-containing transporter [Mycoplasma sp. 2634B]|uniref:PQ-loop domain-containing transporter n=1 Tax=Mycoplasma sp. 2634B TaxID=3401692 RepID=UPI003AAA9FAD
MTIFSIILGFLACLPVLFGSYKLIKTKQVDGFSVFSIMVSQTGSLCYSIMGWNNPTYLAIIISGGAVYFANVLLMSIYFAYSKKVITIRHLKFGHWEQFALNLALWFALYIIIAIVFSFVHTTSSIFEAFFSFLAPFLIAFAVMPQIIETFKTKDVKNLSLPMFSISQVLCTCWLIWWSINTNDNASAANIIGVCAQVFFFSINAIQIVLIIKHRYIDKDQEQIKI